MFFTFWYEEVTDLSRTSTYQLAKKLRGNEIDMRLTTLRTRKNKEKLKLSSTNKTHVYSFIVTFDMLRPHVVTEKS